MILVLIEKVNGLHEILEEITFLEQLKKSLKVKKLFI